MRKQDELTHPESCLNKAKDSEWLFVLLGRDLAAPAAVRAWIEERVRRGKNSRDDARIIDAECWIDAVLKEQAAEAMTPQDPIAALDKVAALDPSHDVPDPDRWRPASQVSEAGWYWVRSPIHEPQIIRVRSLKSGLVYHVFGPAVSVGRMPEDIHLDAELYGPLTPPEDTR